MIDNHRAWIGDGAGVGDCPAHQRLQRAVGADGVGQDIPGGVNVLRINQVDVLGAGVNVAR